MADAAAPSMPLRSDPNIPYYVVTAVLTMGYGSVFTLLAEFRNQFGFSESQLGLIASAGFFAGFAAQVGLAPLADRGRTPQMIRFGVALAAVGMFGMVIADELWMFVGSRIVFGLSTGAVAPAMRRLLITRDPEAVGTTLGRLTAFDITGFVLGPALAAVMVELGGIRLPFIVLVGANLLLLVWVGRLDLRTPPGDGVRRATLPLLRIPRIQSAMFAGVAFFLTLAYFEATWALLLDDNGAETWLIGLSLSLFTIPMILLAPRGGRLAQQKGHASVVGWSIAVAAVCTLAYGWVDILWVLLLVSLVHAIADAFTMPANQVAVATATPPEQLAAGQGLFSAAGTLVSGIVAFAAGALYEAEGPKLLFTSASVAMVFFLALSLLRDRAGERERVVSARG
ncbi:MAG: DHA1 family multidrug resistance protein-like MFS transporter [Candidatus Aldehydirespiratoraceae bacterium]|jgi:DHA1 family multidrug resistance protein-like MFS transporter